MRASMRVRFTVVVHTSDCLSCELCIPRMSVSQGIEFVASDVCVALLILDSKRLVVVLL